MALRAPLTRPRLGAAPVVLLLAAVLGCSHAEPYGLRDYAVPNIPAPIGSLDQLTFSVEGDFAPAWMPGDTMLTYARLAEAPFAGDRCIAFYGLNQLRVDRMLCPFAAVNAVRSTATSPGGRLAWSGQSNAPGALIGTRAIYVLGASDTAPVLVQAIPFATSTNAPVTDVEQLAWLNEQRLVFIAVQARATQTDMQSFPEVIDVLDIGGQPVRTEVPNSARPTSVTVDPADGTLYATFVNDSLVYRVDPSTGQRTVARNFGPYIPRDASVAARRVAAIVLGRRVTRLPSGIADSVDEGGYLAWASLDDSLPPTLVANANIPRGQPPTPGDLQDRWFRHLALSSDGRQLVAEGYPVVYHPVLCPPCTAFDTTVTKVSDLFRVRLP